MTVAITFEYGIVIRRAALSRRSVALEVVLTALEIGAWLGEDPDLLSTGASFGQEACDGLIKRLEALGLIYFDDFVDLSFVHPSWLKFSATVEP